MKVLVANRGEIACRVMAALRERGWRSVAVASEADRTALHARTADECVEIGPAAAAQSYLDIERILDAAKRSGAQAIHPGYGFLSENAAFASAVEAAGLVFLGPRGETMALLGDKRRARAVAIEAGVPVVPGWEGDPSDLGGATKAAAGIGWPVLVKAALGGGGKGMTRVSDAPALSEALEAAARVAKSAFGDASVFLEKAIPAPRHVEVQIFGDGKGHVVHLGERECSLQRRHQKVVEESPSSAIDADLRRRLTEAAVAIGRAVKYRSAGTCEFLVAPDGSFYFLEVNARIQVEHPVTELVTGRDLVHSQLELAETGEMPLVQEELVARGFAVEARVYAEDPDSGFLPQSGRLLRVEFPSGPWLRVDAGVATGDEITPHYDPMIAKVIAFGSSRERAWRRLARALDATVVHGPVTNLAFLRELVSREDVRRGEYHVTSIEETFLPERAGRVPDLSLLVAAAAIADRLGLSGNGVAARVIASGEEAPVDDPFDTLAGWRHS
ncbi:MAG: biotin carboxylase N-terminal domain-containing protein [bacterium]